MDDNLLSKEQSDVIKSIEVEIDKCIQILIARKEALIKAVTDQFKLKRGLMQDQQAQISSSIVVCKKLLDAGTAAYDMSADVAKKTWASLVDLKKKVQITPYPVVVQFNPIPEFHSFGKVLTEPVAIAMSLWLPSKKHTLIYRASRDGFKAADFHRICDNKGPTLTIICSHPHNYLFGGYTSLSWNVNLNNAWINDPNAFIFTLTNPHGIPPTKYPVTNPAAAIYSSSSFCVNFGGGCIAVRDGGNTRDNNPTSNFPTHYSDTTGKGKITFVGTPTFTPNELEVYTVV